MTKQPRAVQLAAKGLLKNLKHELRSPFIGALAACKHEEADLFFAEDELTQARAKSICAACPIREMCLDWGVRAEEFGIFGGMTAKERAKVRGSLPILHSAEIDRIESEERFIVGGSASEVAEEYGVDARTVVRWRQTIRNAREAS